MRILSALSAGRASDGCVQIVVTPRIPVRTPSLARPANESQYAMRTSFALIALAFALPASAADWPQFKGPNGSGVSSEKELPAKFTAVQGLRWKSALPSRGVSSPVVFGDKVFVTCSGGIRDDRLMLLAFDTATGDKLWQRGIVATGATTAHPKTCMAAPTPVADASGVYALFATGDILACDHDGNVLWVRSLTGDYPTISNQVGMASSPVLYKDKFIVPMDNAGESFLAALDTKTGKNAWKTTRPRDINWVTPVIRELTSSDAEVLYQGPKELVAYNAVDGKQKWSHKAGSSSPTPTMADGFLLTSSDGITLAKPGEGKLEEVWKAPKHRTGYSSALYYDGMVYATIPATGFVNCIDGKTGKTVWEERVPGKGKQTFSASPIAGDGKIYVLTESGTVAVFKAGGTEAELVGISEAGEELLATPAISGGAVFIRSDKSLICMGAKATKK